MELIVWLLTVFVIGAILAVLVTFGFVLLLWFMGMAAVIALGIILRNAWFRWRYGVPQTAQTSVHIIEADYQDISDKGRS